MRGIGGIPGSHFLSADDAGVLSAKLLRGSVGVLLHVLQGLAVANESMESLKERPRRHEPVSHNMNREAVETHQDTEEGRVDPEFDKVYDQS